MVKTRKQLKIQSNKECINCKCTETPQWRKYSNGHLCNKCGVQLYRKGYIHTTRITRSSTPPPSLPPSPTVRPPPPRKSKRITKTYRKASHRRKQINPRRALFE
jgi:hypothetical protein